MADHDTKEGHDPQKMEWISRMTGQLVDQLCALYGQCTLHTTLTIFRDAAEGIEGIEAACNEMEKEGSAGRAAAEQTRTEVASMLRGLANIIKAEGDYDVTTNDQRRPH